MSESPSQHLYLTMGGTHPASMSEWNAQHSHMTMGGLACHYVRKAIILIFDHIGPNPIVTSEWPALTSDLLVKKAVALISV